MLASAIAIANQRLADAGEVPPPAGVSPHKLRHTYGSILAALGVDVITAQQMLGHADPAFTMRVYQHVMRRDPASRQALRELVSGSNVALLPDSGPPGTLEPLDAPGRI